MKDKAITTQAIPTKEEMDRQYLDYQHQLDNHGCLKPQFSFDSTDIDDLFDLLDTGNTLYIDHLNKEMEKGRTATDKPAGIEEADLSTLFIP